MKRGYAFFILVPKVQNEMKWGKIRNVAKTLRILSNFKANHFLI